MPFGNGKTAEEPGTHGFVVDGSWIYAHSDLRRANVVQLYSSRDALFNTGLVNRFGHAQIGTLAQFDYASLGLNQLVLAQPIATAAFTRGGTLLTGGVLTFDWVFKGFTAGVLGAKGIKNTGNITTTSLTAVTTPSFLQYADQAGVSFQATFRKFQVEGSDARVKRNIRRLDEQPSGVLKVSFGPSDTMQFYIEAMQIRFSTGSIMGTVSSSVWNSGTGYAPATMGTRRASYPS